LIQVYLYSDDNHAEEAQGIQSTVLGFKDRFELNLHVVDISEGHWLITNGTTQLPELHVGGFVVNNPQNPSAVETNLLRAHDYLRYSTERRDQPGIDSLVKPVFLTGSDRLALWFSRSYVWFIALLVLIYVGLPFLAPVLMKTGHPEPASLIYRGYRLVCHELGYRSFYLFGEQVAYPRELAGVDGLKTFEEVSSMHAEDLAGASSFVGNKTLGYKVALCQRDVAIYASILLFALIFGLTKRKIKAIPWFVWLVVALGPIGLDGVSQLVSQLNLPFLSWLSVRESTPFLRVLTGFLFGWFTAWYAFPTIEESLLPTRKRMEMKALASAKMRLE
jgi:uncharacterized membrane protein